MARQCPGCGERAALHAVARSEYAPMAPLLAGGFLLALVYALSRRRRLRCEGCGVVFETHTVASRLWWALWMLFWAFVALIVIGLLLGSLVELGGRSR